MADAAERHLHKFTARLKQARQEAGHSQIYVAQKLGVHRPSISLMETGKRRVAAHELATMAELYNVSVAWLLGGEEQDVHLERAARKLAALDPDDLKRLLTLISALRDSKKSVG
jgi:transcriptional regulator with XRE-family HTH domain